MKDIIVDEIGNPINELANRNNEIKSKLAQTLEEFVAEKNENRAYKVKEKLGYRFAKQIFLVLSEYPRMTPEKFTDLEYEDIEEYWKAYLELTAFYNRYFEIVDNRQLFLAFLGINSRQYAELENSENEDIKSLMNHINTTFVGLGFVAGESGNADVKAVNTRLRANGEAGHGIISASEDKLLEKVDAPSENELMSKLANIIGGDTRKLLK